MTPTMQVLKATVRTAAQMRKMTPQELAQHDVDVTRARLDHARATGEGYPVATLERWLAVAMEAAA
jgi:hypothetical protein